MISCHLLLLCWVHWEGHTCINAAGKQGSEGKGQGKEAEGVQQQKWWRGGVGVIFKGSGNMKRGMAVTEMDGSGEEKWGHEKWKEWRKSEGNGKMYNLWPSSSISHLNCEKKVWNTNTPPSLHWNYIIIVLCAFLPQTSVWFNSFTFFNLVHLGWICKEWLWRHHKSHFTTLISLLMHLCAVWHLAGYVPHVFIAAADALWRSSDTLWMLQARRLALLSSYYKWSIALCILHLSVGMVWQVSSSSIWCAVLLMFRSLQMINTHFK